MKETDNLLRENSHDRDISEIVATITALDRPSPSLLRFTAFVPGSANNPVWAEANVAIRLYLSEEFDDATRVYTVRSFDAATESTVVDVVQHHHESLMMCWSDTVKINDTLVLTGPRPHFVIPEGEQAALFLDDTAIPALAAILDQWPTGLRGKGWVVTDDPAAFDELPSIDGLELNLLAPGSDPTVQPLAQQAYDLENPETYVVWAAGERDEMKSIRRHFRKQVGLEKDAVAVFGYWKYNTTNTQIDAVRKENYMKMLSEGLQLENFDDLSLEI